MEKSLRRKALEINFNTRSGQAISALLVKDDGEAEAGEGRDGRHFAGAYCGAAEMTARRDARELVRQAGQVRGFEPGNAHRLRGIESAILVAAPAGLIRVGDQPDAVRLQQAANLLLLLFPVQLGNGSGEILGRVQLSAATLDRYTNRVHLRIENVRAMRR